MRILILLSLLTLFSCAGEESILKKSETDLKISTSTADDQSQGFEIDWNVKPEFVGGAKNNCTISDKKPYHWDWHCYDTAVDQGCGVGVTSAHAAINKYIKCAYQEFSEEPAFEYAIEVSTSVYSEAESIEEPENIPCEGSSGNYTNWNYLDFNLPAIYPSSNCELSGSKLQTFADYLISVGNSNKPNNSILYGVEVLHTNWLSCEYRGNIVLANCTACNGPFCGYPCHALFWDSNPDCSLCKTFCTYRSATIQFTYAVLAE